MADPKTMTVEEFNRLVMDWTRDLIDESKGNIHSVSGDLASSITSNIRYWDPSTEWSKENKAANRIKVDFSYVGIFHHYGVGRGWIRKNGALVRGGHISKERQKEFVTKRGWTKKDAAKIRILYGIISKNTREPVDWLNKTLNNNWSKLADIAQEFYGDFALRDVLNQLDKVLIKSND